MKLLLQQPDFVQLTLSQGLWGAQSAKPTTLAVLNAPDLCMALHSGRVTTELPKSASIGKDKDGHWATSKLKEYPPGLCRALATGILQAICQISLDISVQVSSHFQEVCRPLLCTEYGEAFGPDYAS